MPTNVKLNKWEQSELAKQKDKLNKELEEKRQPTIQESDLIHKILKEKIRKCKVDAEGRIIIE